jgi:class 3 adenylate cyclase/predicted ATPase
MSEIREWLDGIALGQYADAFEANDIEVDLLGQLDDQILKDLGVSSAGHRLRIRNAAAKLIRVAPTGKNERATATEGVVPAKSGERRHVTVMFSDLVGSTALSARMDPEDLREVISAYQKCVAETVRRFGGFVAKYMGDGVLVYFGYPQAHEDDAERAVRAGLELITAVATLKSAVTLQTRVGIATGLVIIGDLIGSGSAQEQAVVGETPNLAARLQGIAEPNMVVIAGSTQRLLGKLFELEDLGAKDLKGITEPVRVWAALRPASVESRFEALHAGGVTELVGRDEELEILLRRWSRAKNGDGQVVLISGEPGIGKSRLTAALMESLAGETHTRLRYFCSPQHTDSALYPIISQMERAAGLTHDDTPQAKLDKLDAVLAQTTTSKEDAALLAEMLSLSNDGRYPAIDLAPQQRRQKTLEALTAQMEALARLKPLLMIFEDAHWTDPTSLEAFGRTVDRVRNLRVLLIVTFRPEFEPPWIGRPYVTALTLNRLAERDIDAMIDRVVGNKSLPGTIRQDIVERTDGIPLFVEEMTKAVLEAGDEGVAERVAAAVPSSAQSVPASLHASLMARLDRLGPAKEIAQIGAAIGREFSHALLATVVGKPEAELKAVLDRLVQSGLLFQQGVPPHAVYLFKHALVQDAAYGTLLREARRSLHARIAAALENGFPEIVDSLPELLARHYTEAGLIEKAALLWGRAGQRSLERSALVEAAEQFARALGQIATLTGTPALRREQIKFQVGLASALMPMKGHAASETRAAFDRARLLIEQAEALGEPPEDPLLLFSVLYGFYVASWSAFDGDLVRERAAQFLTIAEKQAATGPLMQGHRQMGAALTYTGDIAQGQVHFDHALALYDPAEHQLLATRFGQDVRVSILFQRSLSRWLLGHPDGALRDVADAISHARVLGHAASMTYALLFTWFTQIFCGNYSEAAAQADEIVTLADEKNSAMWKACGKAVQGSLAGLRGQATDAVKLIAIAISELRSTGLTLWMPFWLSQLAKAHYELGQFDEAWRRFSEAMTVVKANKEVWYEAELYRNAGEVALATPEHDAAKAQAYFERALSVARQQQSKSWELRAAMSMARLWRDQGKRDAARELLAPVYGWFTEGFDTRDLKEAKALLEELAA